MRAPGLFPGRMSYKATKPVLFYILACLHCMLAEVQCIVIVPVCLSVCG